MLSQLTRDTKPWNCRSLFVGQYKLYGSGGNSLLEHKNNFVSKSCSCRFFCTKLMGMRILALCIHLDDRFCVGSNICIEKTMKVLATKSQVKQVGEFQDNMEILHKNWIIQKGLILSRVTKCLARREILVMRLKILNRNQLLWHKRNLFEIPRWWLKVVWWLTAQILYCCWNVALPSEVLASSICKQCAKVVKSDEWCNQGHSKLFWWHMKYFWTPERMLDDRSD